MILEDDDDCLSVTCFTGAILMGDNVKLYTYYRSSASFRVRIALNMKAMACDFIPVHLAQGAQHDGAFRHINPQGLVPVLETDDGVTLSQSLAIVEYLNDICPAPALLPQDPVARAKVRSMAALVACDIHPLNNLRVLKYLKGSMDVAPPAPDERE